MNATESTLPSILFCASEATPFVKSGGLADVVGSLPKALKKLGCNVRIFIPLYRSIRDAYTNLNVLEEKIFIPVGLHHFTGYLWKTQTPEGIEVYLLEKDEFFDRTYLYGNPDPQRGDYEDNAERFIFFSRSVYSLCLHINWVPNIMHLHDWQAALIAPYLKHHWQHDPTFKSVKCVLTVHNLAFQGIFSGPYYTLTHLPAEFFTMEGMEYWGQCNFLKGGIVCSDFVTTVSPTYMRQIQTPEHGYGLDGVLRNRSDRLTGILNGIDFDIWNPSNDPYLPVPFDHENLAAKKICKKHLLRETGLLPDLLNKPLCATIGRMTHQKGYDLIHAIAPRIFERDGGLIVLGTGDPNLVSMFRDLKDKYPDRCATIFEFNEAMAHIIEAGADIFLMPSRFEPCGLNQMYSLRYGTVPVVHATGGLEDSVIDIRENPGEGTGIKFRTYSTDAFWEAIAAAFDLYEGNQDTWQEMQKRGMRQDFSWQRSAQEYLSLYKQVLGWNETI